MPRLAKKTIPISIRIKAEALGIIDERVADDPRFVSRAEFISYSIEQTYADLMIGIYADITSNKSSITQSSFDEVVIDRIFTLSQEVATSRTIFDSSEGEAEIVQIRLSREILECINRVCKLASIKKIDFFKHAIITQTLVFIMFHLNKPKCTLYRSLDSDEFVQLDTGDEWSSSIADAVLQKLTKGKRLQ